MHSLLAQARDRSIIPFELTSARSGQCPPPSAPTLSLSLSLSLSLPSLSVSPPSPHPSPPSPPLTASLAKWLRRPPRERKVPGSNPACAEIVSGSSHTSDLNIGTPVATLTGTWRYRVSAGTGRPSVSILWLGEMESWICNFYLSVAARKIVWADLSLRYTRVLLGR